MLQSPKHFLAERGENCCTLKATWTDMGCHLIEGFHGWPLADQFLQGVPDLE